MLFHAEQWGHHPGHNTDHSDHPDEFWGARSRGSEHKHPSENDADRRREEKATGRDESPRELGQSLGRHESDTTDGR